MDIERTMQFILDQQARANGTLTKVQQTILEVQQTILEVGRTLVNVANAQERTNEILASLAERQIEAEEARRATEAAINRLAEQQKITEENLNVLLLTVERHISNHN